MSAIYIGCGTDVMPIRQFDAIIKHFVYVDSLPYCGWDDSYKNTQIPFSTHFIPEFLEKMRKIGYTLITPFPEMRDTPDPIYLAFERINMHGERVLVECYFSTPFPALRPSIRLELYGKIARASYLIGIGHEIHRDILDLVTNYTLITNTNTSYAYFENDGDNFVKYLYDHPELQKNIKNVLVYHPQKLVVTTFPNIEKTCKTLIETYGRDKENL
jgi:hypothetical protein